MTSPLVIRPEYLQAIGRIDAEWSTIEHVMLAVFQMLMGVDSARAHAAFSELPSHRTRRDVLMRVAEVALSGKPELLQFKQLDRRLARAARARNQIAHATWGLLDGEVVVLDPRSNWSAQKISIADLKTIETSIAAVYLDFLDLIKALRGQKGESGRTPLLPDVVSATRHPPAAPVAAKDGDDGSS